MARRRSRQRERLRATAALVALPWLWTGARAQPAAIGKQAFDPAGNDAQQRIRSILSSAGMTVVSSQVLPAKDEKGIERIPLAVRAEGDIVALQGALAGLAEQKPALLVDDMFIQAQGAANKGPQRLAVQFSLSVLRRVQP